MVEANPLVSVIMPAYNCEEVVEESMMSVIRQSFEDWELIVIDDGSKDRTLETIERVASTDPRVKSFPNEKNMGVSKTRNRGIALARGTWIALLDSDDQWHPLKLEKQLQKAHDKSSEFLFTGASYINENGKPYKGISEVPDKVTYKKLRNRNVIPCSSVLIKKKYLEKIKMERDDIHEDFATWLRILRLGIEAHGVNEPLLIYRLSTKSKSGNKIKGIKMTYNVYRFIGINPPASAYFTIRHLIGATNKYRKIFFKRQ